MHGSKYTKLTPSLAVRLIKIAVVVSMTICVAALTSSAKAQDCTNDGTGLCSYIAVGSSLQILPPYAHGNPSACYQVSNNNCPDEIMVPYSGADEWVNQGTGFIPSNFVTAEGSCVTVAPCNPIAVSLTPTPASITPGSQTNLSWLVQNFTGSLKCIPSSNDGKGGADGSWPNAQSGNPITSPSGSNTVYPLGSTGATVTYTLVCTDSKGAQGTGTTTVSLSGGGGNGGTGSCDTPPEYAVRISRGFTNLPGHTPANWGGSENPDGLYNDPRGPAQGETGSPDLSGHYWTQGGYENSGMGYDYMHRTCDGSGCYNVYWDNARLYCNQAGFTYVTYWGTELDNNGYLTQNCMHCGYIHYIYCANHPAAPGTQWFHRWDNNQDTNVPFPCTTPQGATCNPPVTVCSPSYAEIKPDCFANTPVPNVYDPITNTLVNLPDGYGPGNHPWGGTSTYNSSLGGVMFTCTGSGSYSGWVSSPITCTAGQYSGSGGKFPNTPLPNGYAGDQEVLASGEIGPKGNQLFWSEGFACAATGGWQYFYHIK
jgi:hypothetical protein